MTTAADQVIDQFADVPHTRCTRSGSHVIVRFSLSDRFDQWDHTTFEIRLPQHGWSGEITPARVGQSGAALPLGTSDGMRATADVLVALANVKDLLASEAVLAPMRAEADRRKEEDRKQREADVAARAAAHAARVAEAEERAKLAAARSEQLLTEFLGEKVRVRLTGMKRWRPATVGSEVSKRDDDGEPCEWRPVLTYQFEKHGYQERNVGKLASLEVKVGSRYRNVWGADLDDLDTWDRGKVSVGKPYDGMPQ